MSEDTEKFYRIIGELDRILTPGAGEKFWSARPIFAEMDRSFLNGWAARRVQDLLDDKDFLVFQDRNSLTINITRGYAVSLARIDRPPADLYLYPQHYMARNVGRAALDVSRFSPDRIIRNDVYDPDVRLVQRDSLELQPGDTIARNGYEDVLDWRSREDTGFLLRLHSESLGDYEWAGNRETRAPKGSYGSSTVFRARSQRSCRCSQSLGAPVGRGILSKLGLGSPHFHVRWETPENGQPPRPRGDTNNT